MTAEPADPAETRQRRNADERARYTSATRRTATHHPNAVEMPAPRRQIDPVRGWSLTSREMKTTQIAHSGAALTVSQQTGEQYLTAEMRAQRVAQGGYVR